MTLQRSKVLLFSLSLLLLSSLSGATDEAKVTTKSDYDIDTYEVTEPTEIPESTDIPGPEVEYSAELDSISIDFNGSLSNAFEENFGKVYKRLSTFCEDDKLESAIGILNNNEEGSRSCLRKAFEKALGDQWEKNGIDFAAAIKRMCNFKSVFLECYIGTTAGGYERCLSRNGKLLNLMAMYLVETTYDAVCDFDMILINGVKNEDLNTCLETHHSKMAQCITDFGDKILGRPLVGESSVVALDKQTCKEIVLLTKCLNETLDLDCNVKEISSASHIYAAQIISQLPCYSRDGKPPLNAEDALLAIDSMGDIESTKKRLRRVPGKSALTKAMEKLNVRELEMVEYSAELACDPHDGESGSACAEEISDTIFRVDGIVEKGFKDPEFEAPTEAPPL